MEVLERFRLHLARGFGVLRARAEDGDERARPAHRVVVGHVREAARRCHARIAVAWGIVA
jgi:hypothetical protein